MDIPSSYLSDDPEELKETINQLYSIIWLIVRQFPNHIVHIPPSDIIRLDKRDCFTTWTDLNTGSIMIEAKTEGD